MDVWMLAMGVAAMVAIPSVIWSVCAAVAGACAPKRDPKFAYTPCFCSYRHYHHRGTGRLTCPQCKRSVFVC